MNKFILFLLLISIHLSYSQFVPEWVQLQSQTNLNIDNANLSAMDASGNIYVTNVFNNAGNADLILTKFNSSGVFLWQKEHNSSPPENQDFPKKLIIDQSGNIIIAGNSNSLSYTDNKVFILIYNSAGTLINSTEYKRAGTPVTSVADIAKDNAGNFIISGKVSDTQSFIDSLLIAKFNSSLSIQWVKTLRDSNSYFGNAQSLKIDPSNNVYISGNSDYNILNIKCDNSGNIIWYKKFSNSGPYFDNHRLPLSFLDNSQNLYVATNTREVINNDTTKTLLLKYNSAGVLQWSNTYNISTTGTEGPRRIFSDNSDIFLDVNYYDESYLVKVNTAGALQWSKPMDHYVYYMNLDNSNSIITTGYKNAYQRKDVCMEKFSSSGTLLSSYTYSYNGSGFDQATTFFNTTDSKLLLGGYHNSSLMFLKLTPSSSQLFSMARTNLLKPILDSQVTYDTISISTMQLPPYSQVKNVYINIDTIMHTAIGDLYIMLSHDNKTDTLLYQRGGSLDNMIGTKFSDTSVSIICGSGAPPYTGYFRPCFPLSQFKNLSATGPWILKIFDRRLPDTGFLKAWSITVEYEIPIGLTNISGEIPETFNLGQNYPNPFNPGTKIRFSIPRSSFTKIVIYDIIGREISTLLNNRLAAGIYETEFNAADLPSGVYFYKLTTEDFSETKKMLLIK